MGKAVLLPLALLALLISACDDDALGPGIRVDLTGNWVGQTEAGDTFELTLVEDDRKHDDDEREVTGSGAITGTSGSRAFLVEGVNLSGRTESLPSVNVSLVFFTDDPLDGDDLIVYRARFTARDRLRGELNGGGFDQELLRLRRVDRFDDDFDDDEEES